MRTTLNLMLLLTFMVSSLLFLGCKGDDTKKASLEKPVPSTVNEADLQLVSLKVPNMV